MLAGQEIMEMDDLGAIVISAKGNHFSAGIDLKDLNTFNSEYVFKSIPWAQSVYSFWEEIPVPVVVAIQDFVMVQRWNSYWLAIFAWLLRMPASQFLKYVSGLLLTWAEQPA